MNKYQAFYAFAQGEHNYKVRVFAKDTDQGTVMTIMASEEIVYITKQEVMEFFNLKEKD